MGQNGRDPRLAGLGAIYSVPSLGAVKSIFPRGTQRQPNPTINATSPGHNCEWEASAHSFLLRQQPCWLPLSASPLHPPGLLAEPPLPQKQGAQHKVTGPRTLPAAASEFKRLREATVEEVGSHHRQVGQTLAATSIHTASAEASAHPGASLCATQRAPPSPDTCPGSLSLCPAHTGIPSCSPGSTFQALPEAGRKQPLCQPR